MCKTYFKPSVRSIGSHWYMSALHLLQNIPHTEPVVRHNIYCERDRKLMKIRKQCIKHSTAVLSRMSSPWASLCSTNSYPPGKSVWSPENWAKHSLWSHERADTCHTDTRYRSSTHAHAPALLYLRIHLKTHTHLVQWASTGIFQVAQMEMENFFLQFSEVKTSLLQECLIHFLDFL